MEEPEESDSKIQKEDRLKQIKNLRFKIKDLQVQLNLIRNQLSQNPGFEETLRLNHKSTYLTDLIQTKLKQIIDLQDRQKLVESYERECDSIQQNLKRLDKQVNQISNGDIRALKNNITKLKFIPNLDQKFNNQIKRPKNVLTTGYPSNSPSHRKLLKSCTDGNNRNLMKLIHTSERIKFSEINQKL